MAKYKVAATFVCEGEVFGSTLEEDEVEVPRIFKNRLQTAMRTIFDGVIITISKCERIKEKEGG